MAKGERTRADVLDAALALASKVGLEGLTIGKLAEHVGMSKSGLFAHFSSKDNLGVAILEEARQRFVALVLAPALKYPRGEPRLRALLEHWLAWTKSDFLPGGCIFLSASAELDDRPGAARDALVASQRDWLGTLRGAARIAIEEGHFRKDVDAEQLAMEICSVSYGFHYLGRLLRDPKAEARTKRAVERILAAARPPASGAPVVKKSRRRKSAAAARH
jgi:AcrR family transcriptional regulator